MSEELTTSQKEVIEQQYLTAKANIIKKYNNKGDRDEVLLLSEIFCFSITNQFDKLVEIFGDAAEKGITLINLDDNTIINDFNQIKKAKGKYKADCIIKFIKTGKLIYPSIKSENGGNVSIMNHQRRDQEVFQPGPKGYLNHLLPDLDRMVRKYHNLRDEGLPEEIMFENLHNFLLNTFIKKLCDT